MTSALRRRQQQRLFTGLYRGLVVDAADPLQSHRVRVSFPWLAGSTPAWASTLRDPTGPPEVGDEVVVGFDAGRITIPYVLGVLAGGAAARSVELSDANGNALRLSSSGVEITSSSAVHLTASTTHLSSGTARVDCAMSEFSGVVKADTLIATSVVAASYTPGAGNIM
jgi:hypothetical protein